MGDGHSRVTNLPRHSPARMPHLQGEVFASFPKRQEVDMSKTCEQSYRVIAKIVGCN